MVKWCSPVALCPLAVSVMPLANAVLVYEEGGSGLAGFFQSALGGCSARRGVDYSDHTAASDPVFYQPQNNTALSDTWRKTYEAFITI